ncbi:MAG: tetratricopeptide repeat protein [Calditrichaeota bacterium]|nr:tetratricopeptide repeat protein [Calditrichota bacterium]
MLRGIELTVNHHYDEAHSCFDSLANSLPDHPAGPFFKAAVLHSRMLDYESDQAAGEFARFVEEAIASASHCLAQNPSDAWCLFYRGAAYGYRAFHAARQGRYLAAFHDGQLALRDLESAVALDSSLADAYLGIGSYKYWRGKLLRYLSWLPFVPDEREEGIRLIRLAIARGRYSYLTGLNDLAWVLIDAGKYDEAAETARKGLASCPESRFFLWPLAEACFAKQNYPAAVHWYERLLESVLRAPENNHHNEIICRLKLAHAYCALGETDKARMHATAILSLKLEKDIAQRANKKQAMARAILERCVPPADAP